MDTTDPTGFVRVGVFVDVPNIYSNGGQKMRFDILRRYARSFGRIQRLNAYLSFDADRARNDREYMDRTTAFHEVLRDFGFHTDVNNVKWFNDPESGSRYGKANADMSMAVDLILQASNLDLVILVTGDGDFVKPLQAARDMGCRVEVISFDNGSQDLRREADSFTSGYIIPELIPTNPRETPWGEVGSTVRGFCYYHQPDESYGFFTFLKALSAQTWLTDPRQPGSPYQAVFFHDSALPPEVNSRQLPSRRMIFEFDIIKTEQGLNAENVRLVSGGRPERSDRSERSERSETGQLSKQPQEYTWKSRLVD